MGDLELDLVSQGKIRKFNARPRVEQGGGEPIPARTDMAFEDWLAHVSELGDAVDRHLAERGSKDWRHIDIPLLLDQWKQKYAQQHYLRLTERLFVMLAAFESSGSLTTRATLAHLEAATKWLSEQEPIVARELTLRNLVRRLRDECVAGQRKSAA